MRAKNATSKVRKMSDVIVTFKVMPTGVDVNLDDLEEQIKSSVNPNRIEREPVAFGLVALNVTLLVDDAAGQTDAIEDKIKEIQGVNSVEVTNITKSI